MPRILADGCGERTTCPQSMPSANMSEEKANSPLTLGTPSGSRHALAEPATPNASVGAHLCRASWTARTAARMRP